MAILFAWFWYLKGFKVIQFSIIIGCTLRKLFKENERQHEHNQTIDMHTFYNLVYILATCESDK